MIALTGGPCSGRTTALSCCQDLLKDRGFDVYVLPNCIKEIITSKGSFLNL